MVVKRDLEMAYDYMNWDYIAKCLSRFGFHEKWIKLILNCISSVSFFILINGSAESWFQPTRGTR